MRKKILPLILSTMMIFQLTACGSSGNSLGQAGTGADENTGGFVASGDLSGVLSENQNQEYADIDKYEVDVSEHVVVTYLTIGNQPSGKAAERLQGAISELNEILGEKINAELAVKFIPWDNYLTEYNDVISKLDGSVDLVGASSDWLDAWANAKKGYFYALSTNMLTKYAPNTYTSVPKEHWEMCEYNGKIFLIPEDNYTQWTNHGFIYREDWAREAGLRDGVHSWEELTEYFEKVGPLHPELKALWDSDGTQSLNLINGWLTSHSEYIPIDGIATGCLWGGTRSDPYTLVVPSMSMTDSYVEFAKMMKSWNKMGVWPDNVLENKNAQNREEYRKGKVAVEQHHTQTWANLCSATDENVIYTENPDAESGFFYFGEENGNVVSPSITHGAMAISAGSQNPERALMVYDMIRNDPTCYKLFCYGIEGISYAINEEGLRTTPEGYNPDTDSILDMTNFWWGRNDAIEIRDAGSNWDFIDELYTKYDKYKMDYPYGQFVPDVSEIESRIDECNRIYSEYMQKISYGQYTESPENIIYEMQQELALAGIDDVTAALQEQMNRLYR